MFARRPGRMQNLTVVPCIQKEGVDFAEMVRIREGSRKALK
jgi:hypothetical protein